MTDTGRSVMCEVWKKVVKVMMMPPPALLPIVSYSTVSFFKLQTPNLRREILFEK